MRAPTSRAALNGRIDSGAAGRAPPGRASSSWSSLEKYCLRRRAMSPGYLCRLHLPEPAGLVLRSAVGEHRAHAGFLQSLDGGVGVLRACCGCATSRARRSRRCRLRRARSAGRRHRRRPASSWRRTCAARRCGSRRASRPAARCAGCPATCAGGYRRSPASRSVFEASITSALGALMFGRTAEILLPSISTSACSKSPTARSSESTQPPLIRIGRPGAGAC